MFIEDGTGSGYKAKVTNENYLKSFGISLNLLQHINVEGNSYSIFFDQTPAAAGNTFLYLKNNSNDLLIVEGLTIYSTTAEGVVVKINESGTPVGSTSYTPINLNSGSNSVADCSVEVGSAITGLSGGNTLSKLFHNGSDSSLQISCQGGIILVKNSILSLSAVNGLIQIQGSVQIGFHDSSL